MSQEEVFSARVRSDCLSALTFGELSFVLLSASLICLTAEKDQTLFNIIPKETMFLPFVLQINSIGRPNV